MAVVMDEIFGIDRFTENARNIINSGYNEASASASSEFLPIHLFLAILKDENGVIRTILDNLGIDISNTITSIQSEVYKNYQKDSKPTSPNFSVLIKKILNESVAIASDLGTVYIGGEHILLAILKNDDIDFVKEIKKIKLDYQSIKNAIESLKQFEDNVIKPKDGFSDSERQSNLPFFCRDMTKESIEGRYSEITGRDEEIMRLIHILSRKTKNNPILVGEAGVGKTAIIEGFANRIRDRKVPGSFFDKRILSLDVASILSGAKLRGDVEERIISVINEAIEDENIILFIDEIHNIVGAGSVGGKDSLDIANILKPYLTGSELSVIGATTNEEYTKYFEDDAALTRRFQSIKVDELSTDSSITVIENIKKDFESYHGVKIQPDAIRSAVELTDKFITDRYLPDKAIDVIDEASASLKIGREIAIEPEISKLGEKLVKIQSDKMKALERRDFETAESLRNEEDLTLDLISAIIEGKKSVKNKYNKVVTPGIIKEVVYNMTKIPIVATDISNKKLKDLGKNIKARIVGQDHVVDNVVKAIQRSHIGINNPNRPLASFLFLGPTGVGKTELAKALAKELFGSKDLIYQINMSEFMEMHSVSKLIGSPPGYVGFQEGGQLTKYVRKKPYSVILFDELEKAHPDTLNILLQILEEGELTDSNGRRVNFKNTIIVMTSNIGASEVANDNRLGFDVSVSEEDDLKLVWEDMRDRIMEQVKYSVRPEFLNRIDLIDVFRGLNKKDSLEITQIEIDELKLRLIKSRISLDVTSAVIEKICNIAYSKEFGGRNIRRKVQEIIENGLAQFLLDNSIPRGESMVRLKVELSKEGEFVFSRSV